MIGYVELTKHVALSKYAFSKGESDMERLEFERQHYYFELQRKDRLGVGVSLPTGMVTALFGAVAYFFNKIESFSSIVGCRLFSGLVLLMFLSLVYATYALIRSYWRYDYKCIPTSSELEQYWQQLVNFHETYPDESGTAEEEYDKTMLDDYFIPFNDTNIYNNDKKASYLHKANTTIVIVLILSAIAMIPVHYNSVLEKRAYIESLATKKKEVLINDSKTTTKANTTTTKNNKRRSDPKTTTNEKIVNVYTEKRPASK